MKDINISIETCIRYLEKENKRNDFLTFQIKIPKDNALGEGMFKIYTQDDENKEQCIFLQKFNIYQEFITFHNSHEDPLLTDSKNIYLNLHTPTELFNNNFKNIKVYLQTNNLEKEETFLGISTQSINAPLKSKLNIHNFTATSEIDCILTLHLGNFDGQYHEETFPIKAQCPFSYADYVFKYAYIGVQFSYNEIYPEIEEKHIIKGQKGIYETSILFNDDGIVAQGLIPSNPIHLNKISISSEDLKFTEVSTIDEFMEFHNVKPVHFFESTIEFLKDDYTSKNTYSQSRLYKKQYTKKPSHLDLFVCEECPNSFACVQIVPSGLSHELMKKMVTVDEFSDCEIFKLIENKKGA